MSRIPPNHRPDSDELAHPLLLATAQRNRLRLLLAGGGFLVLWLLGAILLLAAPRPRLLPAGKLGPVLPEGFAAVELLDCGEGAAVLDSDLALHCFGADPPRYKRIDDPQMDIGGNYTAWPGHGYVACNLDGIINLLSADGQVLWTRSLLPDFRLSGIPFLIKPVPGNDGQLYVFTGGGYCYVYDKDGNPQDSCFLLEEMDLAGPLLATSVHEIYFTDKAGDIWHAQPPGPENDEWQATRLNPVLQQGDAGLLSEGTVRSILHSEDDPSQLVEQVQPIVLITSMDRHGQRFFWHGPQGVDINQFSSSERIVRHALIPDDNLVVVSDSSGLNRFYTDRSGPSVRFEYTDMRRPLGEFRMQASPDSYTILLQASRFESGRVMRSIEQAVARWPVLLWLTRRNCGGLLVHDYVMHRDHMLSLPNGAEMLCWPDGDGYFLLLCPVAGGQQVERFRISY